MPDNHKHSLRVACEGAMDKVLVINYRDDASMERARTVLGNLPNPVNYPHHPVWHLQGSLSGVFAEGASTCHVEEARNEKPDIIVKAGNTVKAEELLPAVPQLV